MLQGLQVGIFLDCEDRADVESSTSEWTAWPVVHIKPATRRHLPHTWIFSQKLKHKDAVNSIHQTSPSQLHSFVLTSYQCSCLLLSPLNSSKLGLRVNYLWELKQAPNCLLTCWKDLCWLTTQLAPMKLMRLRRTVEAIQVGKARIISRRDSNM